MKNIILVSIDNLRYDCIGYQPDKRWLKRYDVLKYLETPTLDSIADRSLCFTQCISPGTFTTSVHASILTGLYQPRHGVRQFYEKRLNKDVYTLAEVFSILGYETVLATDIPQLFKPLNLHRGFKHIFYNNDDALYKFLTEKKDKRLFLFKHFFDVHEPFMFSEYEVSPDYNKDFYDALITLYTEHNLNPPSDVTREKAHILWRNLNDHIGKRDINILFPYYVRGVSKFDKGRFKYFIDNISNLGLLENTIMVIFSDHGEGRVYEDDPDYFGHSGGVYEDVIRVPLIIHDTNSAGMIIDDLVSLVDIFPTLISQASNKDYRELLPYEVDGILLDSSRKRKWTYSESWLMDERVNSLSIISSSILFQRAIRTEDKKCILYGEPEFLKKERIDNLSDGDFAKGLYRSLLCRFEDYEEYNRILNLLNSGYPRTELIKDFINGDEYRFKRGVVVFNIDDELKERCDYNLQNPHDLPPDIHECIQEVFRIENGHLETEEIFPPLNIEKMSTIVERLFIERHRDVISNIAGDKHLFLQLIEDFIRKKANKPDEFINRICNTFYFLNLTESQKGYFIRMLEDGITEREVFDAILISSGRLKRFLTEEEVEINEEEIEEEEQDLEEVEINKDLLLMQAEIESLRSQLHQIKQSLTWRIGSKFIYLIDNLLFPLGSKRQILFQRFLDRLRSQPKDIEGEAGKERAVLEAYQQTLSIDSIIPLEFKELKNPRVSIIIPVFNNWVYTYNCLKSIKENTPEGLYEIIIVDDASTDHTQDMLQKVDGVTVIKNEENKGFIDSCNRGADVARGEFILFLNNDVLVLNNWLEPLIKTMENNMDAGIVGSKQILPDGRLLEAGIVVFRDGSSRQYGFGYNPKDAEFNYLREVDAVSGASLMIRKSLWKRLGGFDKRYNFAYYEDMDLCFAVRKLGYKVIYQPHSEVIHFSGVTGVKATKTREQFESDNRKVFKEKWLKDFRNYGVDDIYKARERGKRKYLFIITYTTPMPDKHSGFLRTFNMLKILNNNGYKITLLPDDMKRITPYTERLQDMGIEVLYDNNPLDYFKRNGRYFNTVMLVRPQVGYKYLKSVKRYFKNSRLIYDTVDIHFLREQRRAEIEKSPETMAEAKRLKDIELAIAKESDLVITVTEDDKDALLKELKRDIEVAVIPNIHEVEPLENPFKDRRDILFIGGFLHKPNIDAVIWFVKDIFPIIKRELPQVRFYVIGSNPPPEIFDLQGTDVIVTGYVQDVGPYFKNCRLSVAPLRYGAGIKGKITQSLSLGLPVVTTPIGIEGMKGAEGKGCLVADTPHEFAKAVVKLYSDEILWTSLRDDGIMFVKENFSIEVMEERLLNLFGDK